MEGNKRTIHSDDNDYPVERVTGRWCDDIPEEIEWIREYYAGDE